MNASARSAALRAIAAVTHIDLTKAIHSRRHNPILDSEINIEEELINLRESLDSFHVAQESLRHYPRMYAHVKRERRDIMQHCLGLLVRMTHGNLAPRDYNRQDVDAALRRLVGLVMRECRRAGKRIDTDMVRAFRPYLTIRERVWLRDFSMDMVTRAAVAGGRALIMAHKLPVVWAK